MESLKVSTDGEVIVKGKSTSSMLVHKEKASIKEKSKIQAKKQTEVARGNNKNLLKYRAENNESSESEDDNEIDQKIRKAKQELAALEKVKLVKRKLVEKESHFDVKASCSSMPKLQSDPDSEDEDGTENNQPEIPFEKRSKISVPEQNVIEVKI